MKDFKLEVTKEQANALLEVLLKYDMNWIPELRNRLMIQAYMVKIISKLQNAVVSPAKASKLKLSPAQVAAFDICFRDPAIMDWNCEEVAYLYVHEVLRSVLAEINQYLTNLSTVIN